MRAILAAAAILAASLAPAAELEGVTLADQLDLAGKPLVLNGLGLREATVLMVNVYVAGLYLESRTSDPAAIVAPDRAKKLVMSFVRSVGREKLVEAWNEGMEKNAGDKKDAVAEGFQRLCGAMVDVKKGDVIALAYVPGTGTTVTVKGRDAATIPGDEFQRVLFSIWVGPSPPNAGLRDGLLGLSR